MFKYIAIVVILALIAGFRHFLNKREADNNKREQFVRNEREAKKASDNWLRASASDTRTVQVRAGFDAPDYGSFMSGKK